MRPSGEDTAIAAMIWLAERAPAGRGVNGKTIRRALRCGERALERSLQVLVHAGLLASRRGASGGYALARGAGAITLGAIHRALGAPKTSPLARTPHQAAAQMLLAAAGQDALACLDRVTLAHCVDDLAREREAQAQAQAHAAKARETAHV